MSLKASDYIAIGAALVAVAALAVGVAQEKRRRADAQAWRQEDTGAATKEQRLARLLGILVTGSNGVRLLAELDDGHGLSHKLNELRSTAVQLRALAEFDLAQGLSELCDSWRRGRSDEAEVARKAFLERIQAEFAVTGASESLEREVHKIAEVAVAETEKQIQKRVWVGNSPTLNDATFLPFDVWMHHTGELIRRAWQMQAMVNAGVEVTIPAPPPYSDLVLYRVADQSLLQLDATMRDQGVSEGEVWVLLPNAQLTEYVDAQPFPGRRDPARD